VQLVTLNVQAIIIISSCDYSKPSAGSTSECPLPFFDCILREDMLLLLLRVVLLNENKIQSLLLMKVIVKSQSILKRTFMCAQCIDSDILI